jgi:SPFH domain / Band 7 family
MKKTTIAALLFIVASLTACKPVKVLDIEEIKANETAWAIPLDNSSQSGQVKFNSVEFLNAKKVAAKRIMIDKVERSVGRFPWNIEWIPAVRVIKVDRSLVTREWTDSLESGTAAKREGIGVVTKDSVQLRVGLTVTASIDEDDASTYLYFHGEKALRDVLDQNIRSFAVAELTRQYGDLTLGDAQTKGTEIYSKLFDDAKAAFKAKGITIQYLGNAEGLTYADPKVQSAINLSYQASQDAKTAEMEQNAQKIRSATLVMTAQAQADAAKELFAAKEASEFQNEMAIKLLTAQAQMRMASNWDGKMPLNILPANSPMLLNLGGK